MYDVDRIGLLTRIADYLDRQVAESLAIREVILRQIAHEADIQVLSKDSTGKTVSAADGKKLYLHDWTVIVDRFIEEFKAQNPYYFCPPSLALVECNLDNYRQIIEHRDSLSHPTFTYEPNSNHSQNGAEKHG